MNNTGKLSLITESAIAKLSLKLIPQYKRTQASCDKPWEFGRKRGGCGRCYNSMITANLGAWGDTAVTVPARILGHCNEDR